MPPRPTGWAGHQARRACQLRGGHYLHLNLPALTWTCCGCGHVQGGTG